MGGGISRAERVRGAIQSAGHMTRSIGGSVAKEARETRARYLQRKSEATASGSGERGS